MNKSASYRLKGGSLVYALMISLLVSLVLVGLIMLVHYQRMLQEKLYHQELSQDNVFSAINLALGQEKPLPWQAQSLLFESPVDSFLAQSSAWGLYGLTYVRAKHGQAQSENIALWGSVAEGAMQSALILRGSNRALKLVGEAKIEGIAWLPQSGVQKGQINREFYRGKELIYGEIKSNRSLPELISYEHLGSLSQRLKKIQADTMGINTHLDIWEQDTIQSAWKDETLEIHFWRDVLLDKKVIKGKVLIQAGKSIYVSANNSLEHTLLFAPVIIIEEGFEGRIQAFATDSIVVGKGAKLGYPSSVVVAGKSKDSPGMLNIYPEAIIEGAVINDPGLAGNQFLAETYTRIYPKAEIRGQMILRGAVDHRGMVKGNLLADRFMVKTISGVYTDHLKDGIISWKDLSENFSGGVYLQSPGGYRVIEWLDKSEKGNGDKEI
ncbi:MAG: hypothetical protein R3B93_19100 [Bacteroidia bacterium]